MQRPPHASAAFTLSGIHHTDILLSQSFAVVVCAACASALVPAFASDGQLTSISSGKCDFALSLMSSSLPTKTNPEPIHNTVVRPVIFEPVVAKARIKLWQFASDQLVFASECVLVLKLRPPPHTLLRTDQCYVADGDDVASMQRATSAQQTYNNRVSVNITHLT